MGTTERRPVEIKAITLRSFTLSKVADKKDVDTNVYPLKFAESDLPVVCIALGLDATVAIHRKDLGNSILHLALIGAFCVEKNIEVTEDEQKTIESKLLTLIPLNAKKVK